MSDCFCIIGTYERDIPLRLSEYVEIINDMAKVQRNFAEMGLLRSQPLTSKEISDNRRGYIHRYNYCPYCGVKHDWKQLTKALK
jgi:translation initiation factor 2 beta subunit (eIF-2beta)/eIF-5